MILLNGTRALPNKHKSYCQMKSNHEDRNFRFADFLE